MKIARKQAMPILDVVGIPYVFLCSNTPEGQKEVCVFHNENGIVERAIEADASREEVARLKKEIKQVNLLPDLRSVFERINNFQLPERFSPSYDLDTSHHPSIPFFGFVKSDEKEILMDYFIFCTMDAFYGCIAMCNSGRITVFEAINIIQQSMKVGLPLNATEFKKSLEFMEITVAGDDDTIH